MRREILAACAVLASLAQACGGGGHTGGTGGSSASAGSMHTSSSQSAGGAGPCGSLVWDGTNKACNQCTVDKCCAELRACDAGTKCGDLIACASACAAGDTTCVKGCGVTHALGQAAIDAAFMCYDAHCKATAECGTKVCDSMIVVSDLMCGDCLTTSCCDSWKTCAADAICLPCLTTSPMPADCAGDALLKAAVDCRQASCAMTCAATICDSGLGTSSHPCNYCLGQSCCSQIKACAADATCQGCLTSAGKNAGCATNTLYTTYTMCVSGSCATACGG